VKWEADKKIAELQAKLEEAKKREAELLAQVEKKNICKNCEKELQGEWKLCPYCGTAVATTTSVNKGSAIVPGSIIFFGSGYGGGGYGIALIKPQE
jgi:hypothetical protein